MAEPYEPESRLSVSCVFLALAPRASGQSVSAGVIAGGILTKDFASSESTYYTPSPSRLLIGPSHRVRMRSGLGFEAAALHKRLKFQFGFGRPGLGCREYGAEATAWQFPLLLQYGRRRGRMLPYLSAGLSFRHVGAAQPKVKLVRNCLLSFARHLTKRVWTKSTPEPHRASS